jgi:hypothetical protein
MAAKEAQRIILDAIADFFISTIKDGGFNGLVANALVKKQIDEPEIKHSISGLVANGAITCTFSAYDVNIHIKRMPSLSIERQIQLIAETNLTEIGCYPTNREVRKRFDLDSLNDRPFSKMLAGGESQIDFISFDFAVLERYFNDPRFDFSFEDYGGHLSIKSQYYKKGPDSVRDDVYIQTFGLGFDASHLPVTIVFLRYLSRLNSTHQLYWKSYQTSQKGKMCKQYYQSSILGNFYENASLIYALKVCIDGINEVSTKIFGAPLFRSPIPDARPLELGVFVRPTTKNFQRFVIALDHVLSENINEAFFPPSIPRTETKLVRGRAVEQRVGSIRLLENWLFDIYNFHDAESARKALIGPFQQVRKFRQNLRIQLP